MPSRHVVPFTMGASSFLQHDLAGFRVTFAEFSPGLALKTHEHDLASFCVMLEGGQELSMLSRRYACLPSMTTIQPAGASHSNCMSPRGARILAIQPDVTGRSLPRACESLLSSPSQMKNPRLTRLAWAITHELKDPGPAAGLYIEGMVCEMLADAVRRSTNRKHRPPAWLIRVVQMLHDRFLEEISLEELAAEAGVHRMHLAKAFRRHHGRSPGGYLRELRVQWAAERLIRTDDPVSTIAHEAGFADQSHFTRTFRHFTGLTPNQFREARRD